MNFAKITARINDRKGLPFIDVSGIWFMANGTSRETPYSANFHPTNLVGKENAIGHKYHSI